MSAFTRFADRLAAASDATAQRTLLVEIGQWRAQQLTDVAAQRDAAWAMSHLYAATGDADASRREGQMLLTLCTTPPEASSQELREATGWVKSIGGRLPPRPAGKPRKERDRNDRNDRGDRKRSDRPERNDRSDRNDRNGRNDQKDAAGRSRSSNSDVVAEILAGRTRNARAALKGRNDDRAMLLQLWVEVKELQQAPATELGNRLSEIEQALAERLGSERGARRAESAPAPERAAASRKDAGPHEQALVELVGQPLPNKRRDRAEFFDAYARNNPGNIDAFAALALRAHVEFSGVDKPAPWLVGHTALALVSGDASLTRAALADLKKAGAFAVSAYDEPAFNGLVDVLREAVAAGAAFETLRRGVLSRGEPNDRKVWTLRVKDGNDERQIAMASPSDQDLDAELAARISDRLHQLCPLTVLVASGEGNVPLVDAFTASGGSVASGDAASIYRAAAAVEAPSTPPPAPRSAGRADVDSAWASLVQGAERPSVDAIIEGLAPFRRVHHALRPLWRLLADQSPSERGARVVDILTAAASAAPEARLSEGIDLLCRVRAEAPELADSLSAPPLAALGGEGVELVAQLLPGVQEAGIEVRRILRGITGKERRESAVLDPIAEQLETLWRVQLTVGEARRELWVLPSLPPEAVAGVPLLLDGAASPVVVVPIEGGVLDAWRDLGGPEPIGWTGDEAADVVAALQA